MKLNDILLNASNRYSIVTDQSGIGVHISYMTGTVIDLTGWEFITNIFRDDE